LDRLEDGVVVGIALIVGARAVSIVVGDEGPNDTRRHIRITCRSVPRRRLPDHNREEERTVLGLCEGLARLEISERGLEVRYFW